MNERAADDPGVLRFEEHLHVRIETFPRETVRIEKVIVTDRRTITIDVRREELRITRTPIPADGSPSPAVAPRTPLPIVMILRQEQPVIALEVVPVEKVTVDVRVDSTDHHFSEELRHDRIDVVKLPPPYLP